MNHGPNGHITFYSKSTRVIVGCLPVHGIDVNENKERYKNGVKLVLLSGSTALANAASRLTTSHHCCHYYHNAIANDDDHLPSYSILLPTLTTDNLYHGINENEETRQTHTQSPEHNM